MTKPDMNHDDNDYDSDWGRGGRGGEEVVT